MHRITGLGRKVSGRYQSDGVDTVYVLMEAHHASSTERLRTSTKFVPMTTEGFDRGGKEPPPRAQVLSYDCRDLCNGVLTAPITREDAHFDVICGIVVLLAKGQKVLIVGTYSGSHLCFTFG